jgi:Tfp pilus assembly pilus retraction ATPase PilT
MNLRELFKIMVAKEASDMFLSTETVPRARINGAVQIISSDHITKEMMIKITEHLLGNDENKKKYAANFDIDFIYEEADVGRFRINISRERYRRCSPARAHEGAQFRRIEFTNRTFVQICRSSQRTSYSLRACGVRQVHCDCFIDRNN